MTKDEIIEMAKQAEITPTLVMPQGEYFKRIERFAALVAEKEREACALTCETPPQDGWHPYGEVYEENISKKLASAIRARGNK